MGFSFGIAWALPVAVFLLVGLCHCFDAGRLSPVLWGVSFVVSSPLFVLVVDVVLGVAWALPVAVFLGVALPLLFMLVGFHYVSWGMLFVALFPLFIWPCPLWLVPVFYFVSCLHGAAFVSRVCYVVCVFLTSLVCLLPLSRVRIGL